MQSFVRLGTPFVWARSTHKYLPGLHGRLGVVFLLGHCDSVKVVPFTFILVRAIAIRTTRGQSILLQYVSSLGLGHA